MAHDVFISYSTEDKPTADAAVATLEARGIRCWIAPRDVLAGEDYAEALVDGIGNSRIMVLILSSRSNHSPHVKNEVERAASRGLPILPLRIEDVVPSKSMELFISRTHWLDAMTPPLDKHLKRLAETVQLLLDRDKDDEGAAEARRAVAVESAAQSRSEKVFLGWRPRDPLDRAVLLATGASGVLAVIALLLYVAGI